MTPELNQRLATFDAQLIELAKPILVQHLNWPDDVESFLSTWQAGVPVLPAVEIHVPDWTREIAALDDLVRRCSGDDPLLQF